MTGPTLHVIGGGLAGLAAAVAWVRAGTGPVTVYEAAPRCGGRCRSWWDPVVGRTVDNGTHLMLGANTALRRFAAESGGSLVPAAPVFPFAAPASGAAWTLRPGRPWAWHPGPLLAGLARVLVPGADGTVAEALATQPLYHRLWAPLTMAVLNTPPETASRRLLGAVLGRTLARGAEACTPLLAPRGLEAALVAPAVAWLRRHGARVRCATPIRALRDSGGAVVEMVPGRGPAVPVAPRDVVLLATAPRAAARLWPGLPVFDSHPILNVHFRLTGSAAALPRFLGLVGGTGQWWQRRDGLGTVTVSAAEALADWPATAVAAHLWAELGRVMPLPAAVPPCRVVRDAHATPAQTPWFRKTRPAAGPVAGVTNLYLAGDWTARDLPTTLEAAVRSGVRAVASSQGAHAGVPMERAAIPAFGP